MITKMKKYTFLTFHKDHHLFLNKLRDLGVVHVVQKQQGTPAEDSELAGWLNYSKRLKSTIKSLDSIKEEQEIQDLKPVDKRVNGIELLEIVEGLYAEKDQAVHRKNAVNKEIERITPWGEFDLRDLKRLEEENIFIHFHSISASKFKEEWIEEYNAVKINKVGSVLYFLTITNDPGFPEIDAEHVKLFDISLRELQTEKERLTEVLKDIDERLATAVKNNLNTLRYTEREIIDHVNWERVVLSSEAHAEDKLVLLEGYVPANLVEGVNKELAEEDVYFEASETVPDDKPPILLKNNKFARQFEMISNLYDRPDYNAFDLTPFYAPFYVMFFGLCVGDWGYGLLFIIASFFLSKVKNGFLKSVSKLVFWLGIGTVIFGFISGTFFGISMLEQSWPWLDNFRGIILDSNQMFYFALIIGMVQLTYAWIIKIVTTTMRFGFVYALDTVGWFLAIWGNIGIYLLTSNGIVPVEMQTTLFIIVNVIAAALMLFFNNPAKGLKGVPGSIGSGLWGLYNKVTGLLGDVLSYIRLFALGISGAVLGMVFNQLAFGFAPDIVVLKQLVVVLILVFGHAINIFMSGLSAFVHPMRLTFVEFYNNAGFEGGGKPYIPFKKEIKEN